MTAVAGAERVPSTRAASYKTAVSYSLNVASRSCTGATACASCAMRRENDLMRHQHHAVFHSVHNLPATATPMLDVYIPAVLARQQLASAQRCWSRLSNA